MPNSCTSLFWKLWMGCQPLHSGPCKAWHSTCCHVAPLVRKDLLAQFYDRFLTGVPGQEVSSIELRDLGWKEGLKRLIPYCLADHTLRRKDASKHWNPLLPYIGGKHKFTSSRSRAVARSLLLQPDDHRLPQQPVSLCTSPHLSHTGGKIRRWTEVKSRADWTVLLFQRMSHS